MWLALFIVVMTAGELYTPVGLGLFGRLAPAGMTATSIATWYFGASSEYILLAGGN